MDLNGDSALLQAEDLGNFCVVDFSNFIYLQEVVARAQRTQLLKTSVYGPLAYLGGIGSAQAPLFLCVRHVLLCAVPLTSGPGGSALQNLLEFLLGDLDTAFAKAGGH